MANVASLSVIVAAVHGDPILFNASPPISTGTNVPIPGSMGESAKAQKSAPPYAVWIPQRDRYTVNEPNGSRGATLSNLGAFPRQIRTRWASFEIHLNCLQTAPTDFDTMDITVNAFLAAVHRQLHGAYNILEGGIENTFGTELTKDRKVYVIRLEVAIPITEVPSQVGSVVITAVPVTAGITTPTNPPQ